MDFSLKAVFGMDATGLKTELKQVRKETNDFINQWGALALSSAAGAFIALSKGAIDLAGHLSDTSQNIGINVESLQALSAQHKRNGVSEETLTKALEKTKSAVIGAAEGNEKYTQALAKIGLRASTLLTLPLDKQYEAIAKGAKNATDKAAAYSAVTAILGEKVGPKLMASLTELATDGLPKVTAEARKAGQVMSAETIVALDAAGDAIDDFKKRATVAVGNIIVNFRSEEGLKLLGMQFLRVVGTFGAGIVDAIYEGGGMLFAVWKGAMTGVINFARDGLINVAQGIYSAVNKILPKSMEINIKGMDEFKSAGRSVADEITLAIAQTQPSTFKKEVSEFWDKAINAQQLVVDHINKMDFAKPAKQLRDAGTVMKTELMDGGKRAGEAIVASAKEAANAFMAITRSGATYENQSTASLQGAAQRLRRQLDEQESKFGYGNYNSNYGATVAGQTIESELKAALRELSQREEVASYAARNGENAARSAYGDDVTDRALRDMQDATTRNATSTDKIRQQLDKLLGGG